MDAGVLVERNAMRAMVGAEDVATATTVVAAEEEGEWSGTVG